MNNLFIDIFNVLNFSEIPFKNLRQYYFYISLLFSHVTLTISGVFHKNTTFCLAKPSCANSMEI